MILIILFFLAVLKWHNYPWVYDIVETGVYANKDHSKPTKQCDHKVVTPQNSKQNKKNLIIVITNKKAFKWIKPIFAEGKQSGRWADGSSVCGIFGIKRSLMSVSLRCWPIIETDLLHAKHYAKCSDLNVEEGWISLIFFN